MVVKVPRCWNNLLAIEAFPDGTPLKDERQSLADPNPYQKDERVVSVEFDNGEIADVMIASGTGNYYAEISLYDEHGELIDAETYDTLTEGKQNEFPELTIEFEG